MKHLDECLAGTGRERMPDLQPATLYQCVPVPVIPDCGNELRRDGLLSI